MYIHILEKVIASNRCLARQGGRVGKQLTTRYKHRTIKLFSTIESGTSLKKINYYMLYSSIGILGRRTCGKMDTTKLSLMQEALPIVVLLQHPEYTPPL